MQNSNEIKAAAIYVRGGTEMQPQGLSLNEQIEVLKNFAEEQNWQIINIYTDVNTGRKLGMKGFVTLIEDISHGLFDIVLMDSFHLYNEDPVAWKYLMTYLKDSDVSTKELGDIIHPPRYSDSVRELNTQIITKEYKKISERVIVWETYLLNLLRGEEIIKTEKLKDVHFTCDSCGEPAYRVQLILKILPYFIGDERAHDLFDVQSLCYNCFLEAHKEALCE